MDESVLFVDLVGLITKISDHVLESHEVVKKGVSEAIGGKVLELESERLIRIGKEEGIAEGREEGRKEGIEEGREEGIQQERIGTIQRMLRKGYTKARILDLDYTEEEYAKAEEGLC